MHSTAWKVPKYGVISGPYFLEFGLNTKIYTGKYGPEITPNFDNFHPVLVRGFRDLSFRYRWINVHFIAESDTQN